MRKVFCFCVLAVCCPSLFASAEMHGQRRHSDPVQSSADRFGLVKQGMQDTRVKLRQITAKTDDDYCDLIEADKYLLAKDKEQLNRISEMEWMAKGKKGVRDVNSVDIIKFTDDNERELCEEIRDCYWKLRINNLYMIWARVVNVVPSGIFQ